MAFKIFDISINLHTELENTPKQTDRCRNIVCYINLGLNQHLNSIKIIGEENGSKSVWNKF